MSIHAATYTVNYEQAHPWYTVHLWSLSVEEQFYFDWPVLLWMLGPRRGLWVAGSILVLAGMTVLNLAIALIVDYCVRHHSGWMGRLLNWRPVVFMAYWVIR